MSHEQPFAAKKLPSWALVLGSVVISVHFLALGMLVLAADSGPWATRFGESPAMGAYFAVKINNMLLPTYLEPLRLNNNYHFTGNRLNVSSVFLEAKITDKRGFVTTIRFPEKTGNFWLQHRYHLLAMGLGNDQQVQPPKSEVIPAPGQKMKKMTYWDTGDPSLWKLTTVDEHLVPKDRPVMRPSDWSLLLARAYQRFLARTYDAATVELIRHSKDPVMPAFMFGAGAPPGSFDELVCSFGEYRP